MVCENCGRDDESTMKRMGPKEAGGIWPRLVAGEKKVDPALCRACCIQAPGRAWMRER